MPSTYNAGVSGIGNVVISVSLALAVTLGPAAARAGDPVAGKARAQTACQVCHGVDGQAAVAMVPPIPHISGQQKGYLIAVLEAYRSGKRKHEQMNVVAKTLSDEDIENLSEWYSSIRVSVEIPE